jgi:hypothetical protein
VFFLAAAAGRAVLYLQSSTERKEAVARKGKLNRFRNRDLCAAYPKFDSYRDSERIFDGFMVGSSLSVRLVAQRLVM